MDQDKHTGGGSDNNDAAKSPPRLQPETDHGYGGVVDDRDAEKQASSPFFGIHSAKALQELASSTESTTQLSLRMEEELDRLAAAGRTRKRSLLTPMQRRALGLDSDDAADDADDDGLIVEHVGNDIIDAARESMRSQSALSDAERRELEMYRAREQAGDHGSADTTDNGDGADVPGRADGTAKMDFVEQTHGFVVRPSAQHSEYAGVSDITDNNQLSISSQNVQNNHKKVTNMTDWGLYSSQGTTSRVQAVVDAYTELTAVEKHLVNDKLQLQPAHIVTELQAMLTEAADQLALAQRHDREKYADETFPGLEGEALQDALIKQNQEYAQRIREFENGGVAPASSQQALSQGNATETTQHEDTSDCTDGESAPEQSGATGGASVDSTAEATEATDKTAHQSDNTDNTPGGDRGGFSQPVDGADSVDRPVDSRGGHPAGDQRDGSGEQGDGTRKEETPQHTQTIPQATPAGTAPTVQRSGRDIRNASQRAASQRAAQQQSQHAAGHGNATGSGVVASVVGAEDFAHAKADAVASFDRADTDAEDGEAIEAARSSVRRPDTSDADHSVATEDSDAIEYSDAPESIALGDDVDIDTVDAVDAYDEDMLVDADDVVDDGEDGDADGDTSSDDSTSDTSTSGGRERVPEVDEDALQDAFPDDDDLEDASADAEDAGLGDYMRQADPLDAVDNVEPEVGA